MSITRFIFGFVTLLSFATASRAQDVVVVTPWDTRWNQMWPGFEQANLVGDPSQPGHYTVRLKFPPGFKIPPHAHSDAREITVLSGTWYIGYGTSGDPSGLKALPAGSFHTEPAGYPHYAETREPTVIQVSGQGPMTSRPAN